MCIDAPTRRSVRLNLIDRLLLRMERMQGPVKIHCFLELDGELARDLLERALARTLDEVPLLRTRVREGRWTAVREGLAATRMDVPALIRWHAGPAPDGIEAYVRSPLDPGAGPPLALLVHAGGGTTTLVLAIHHSVSDAIGGFLLLDRLARHYTALWRGDPEPPAMAPEPDTRSYLAFLRKLPLPDRLRVAARCGHIFIEALPGRVLATFSDQSPPSRGLTDWRTFELSRFQGLKDRARERGGTLGDLMLTTLLCAACRIWPQPAGRTIHIQLPVNLRAEPRGVANQVGDLTIAIRDAGRPDPDRFWREVTRATSRARDGLSAIARTFERALLSVVPPPLFRRLLGAYMDRPRNGSLSLVFSNLGVLDPVPADFGPAAVTRGWTLGPLISPPGLAVWLTTVRDRLVVCLGFLDPVIAPDSADRLLAAWLEELEPDRVPAEP